LESIRTLMVSTSYPVDLSDWRGLFMRYLVEAFARREDLALNLWAPPGETPANVVSVANSDETQWLSTLMAAGGVAHLMRQKGVRALTSPLKLLSMLRRVYRRTDPIDLYHVNWLQNALPLPRNGRPALITVLGSDFQLLQLPGMKHLLRRACRGRAVAICPNADWMVPALQTAFGDVARVSFVPLGIDPAWFRVERSPPAGGPRQWLCVSRLTRGKLGALFEHGAQFFADTGRELHLFGPMQEQVAVPAWVHFHGPTSPDTLCREWFPGAEGLITLSQHAEGRPQVMLEAMASGLPIIASNLPAHASFLRHGETGWLCDDVQTLGAGLAALEDTPTNRRIGLNAREWVAQHVGTWDDCAERYVQIYRGLLQPEAT
jgi:glycosyltransferase involved in cell wall biosynthesis